MSLKLKLRVIDVVTIAGRKDRLAVVEVIAGVFPGKGNCFVSPDIQGKWKMTEVATHPPDSQRLPIGFESVGVPCELRPGICLIEDE